MIGKWWRTASECGSVRNEVNEYETVISREEVRSGLRKMKCGKAIELDGIAALF